MVDQSTDPVIGRRLEKPDYESYVVDSFLGKGGMASVYSATQESTGREVAVKYVSQNELLMNPNLEARFFDEVNNTRDARMPNCKHVVKIYDAGRYDNDLWFAMEKVDGVDLFETLNFVGGMLELDEIYTITKQTALGLDNAHKNNIFHKDLKPQNILIDSVDDIIKVSDFGLSYAQAKGIELTGAGDFVGSPAWISKYYVKNPMIDIDKSQVQFEDGREFAFYNSKKYEVTREDKTNKPQIRYVGAEFDFSVLGAQVLYTLVKGWNPVPVRARSNQLPDLFYKAGSLSISDFHLSSKNRVYNGDQTLDSLKFDTVRMLHKIIGKAVHNNIKRTYHSGDEFLKHLDFLVELQYGKRYKVDEKQAVSNVLNKLNNKINQRCDSLIKGELTNTLGSFKHPSSGVNETSLVSLKDDILIIYKRMGDRGKIRRLKKIINLNVSSLIKNFGEQTSPSAEIYGFYLDLQRNISDNSDESRTQTKELTGILQKLK